MSLEIHIIMTFPYSSSRAFAFPGHFTIKVMVSTMQAPLYSSSAQGQGVEGPSDSVSETVYFSSSQAGHVNLASQISTFEKDVASL